MAAIEQAYTSYIPPEKFPCCILFMNINPAAVDVNVHPAKLEVKFSNEKPVFEAIYYAVRTALENSVSRPDVTLSAPRRGRIEEKLSDTAMPISDRKQESIAKRQVSAELYTSEGVKNKNDPDSTFKRMGADQYVEQYVKGIDEKKLNLGGTSAIPEKTATAGPVNNTRTAAPLPETTPYGKYISENNTVHQKPEADAQKKDSAAAETPKAEEKFSEKKAGAETDIETVVPKKLEYRIIGEAFNAYVLVEVGDKMLLIDKHAAHERILFEQLKAGMTKQEKASQLLMLPIEVMLTSDEIQILADFREEIEAVGFEFTNGRYTVNVTAIPEGIRTDAVSDMLAVIAERIKSNTGSAKLTRDIIFEKALYQASCKAAIKAGREYPEGHVKWIVDKLMSIPDITVCPHGRPVAMELSEKNLDRQFERT